MIKKLLLFITVFSSHFLLSQLQAKQKSIDSLRMLVKASRIDTVKMDLYYQLCKKHYPEDVVGMKRYNEKLYVLSKTHHLNKGIGLYYLNLTDIDYLEGDFEKAVKDGERAYAILSQTKDIEKRLSAASYLAYAYLDNSNYTKARAVLLKNLPKATNHGDPKILGRFYLFLGETYEDETASSSELKYYKKALFYYNQCNDQLGKISLYQRIAYVYKKINLNNEALKYINLAIHLKPDAYNLVILNLEKARIYNKLKHFKKANVLALQNEQTIINNQLKSSDINWVNALCLAISFDGLKEYKAAIGKCQEILKADIDDDTRMSALNILSHSYLKTNQLQLARKSIDESLLLRNKVNDEGLEDTYKIKSEIEEALGNFNQALYYRKMYTELKDEKDEKINENRIYQLQVDFEVSEKENKIKKLEIIDLQQSLNISKQKNYLIISGFFTVLAMILVVVFLLVARSIKKRNIKIEYTNNELSKSQIIIQKALNEKELLLKEIHHRVKNNFQLVLSLLNIQAREGEIQDINYFLEKGQSRIISMALIHENLYQTEKLDEVFFQTYIENLVEAIQSTFKNDTQFITTEVQAQDINFDIQTSIPIGLIINELFSNILKHAFPNGEKGAVKIEITALEENTYQLIVTDNGVGIQHLENKKKTLGLELVRLLVQQLKGSIETSYDQGTHYRITFKEII